MCTRLDLNIVIEAGGARLVLLEQPEGVCVSEILKLPTHPYVEKSAYTYNQWPGSKAGSYLRLIDSCITQIKAQGPSRPEGVCVFEILKLPPRAV